VQSVLQLVGAVEEDSLFRLCDTVVDHDTAGALLFVEELAEQGQDLGRLVHDLLEHLRHLLLVQHLGHVPESLPVTEETRERLREQANQLPEPTVLRLIDLLAVAVEDMRQGADPRLPLELALVKVTRPAADLSRETLAHRVELLESRISGSAPAPAPVAPAAQPRQTPSSSSAQSVPAPAAPATPTGAEPPEIELSQLQDAWQRGIVAAVRERSIPVATLLHEAHPAGLEGDTLTLEFSPGAEFHRRQVEDAKNVALLRDALYEVTGRKLTIATALADAPRDSEEDDDRPMSEDEFISLFKDTLDAREVEE
jgi:DNA polymerase III subunit gamma/tau